MTRARQVLPGKTYVLARRVTRRHWLLRPDADGSSQQIHLYTFGYNANEHGILVHNLCQMSSHDHETITDVLGTLPLFRNGFHRDLASRDEVPSRLAGRVL
ncbi:MAG: hypothetical protein OEZ06_00885 [Myxococcales bacterium]|nr:hypothetical protein [Myxococcales bacterium]